jgi:hypothetical protein
MNDVRTIPITECAKLIRAALAKNFPDIKFSVRSKIYSGGCHVNVNWNDGPNTRTVDAVVGKFSGKTFDGMDDSTHYHNSTFNGETVHFAGSAPSTSRRVTRYDELKKEALTYIFENCTVTGAPGSERFGNDWVENLASNMVHAADYREEFPLVRAFRLAVLREND